MTITPLRSQPTPRWLVAVAFLALVAHEGHELVHTATGRFLCGAWGARDFNAWSLAPGCDTWVPTLAGPLLSWLAMWTGVLLLASTAEPRRWVGMALVFAPNPLGRLLPALLGGGDEGVLARTWLGHGGPAARALVLLEAAIIVVPPLLVAWRALPEKRRAGWFLLLLAGGILVTGPLLFVLGNRLLQRGVLAQAGPTGAPVLIELFTFAAATGSMATARWLPNVDAPRDRRSA